MSARSNEPDHDRLTLPEAPEPWLASRLPRLGVTPLPVTWQDTTAVSALPPLHRDPFDRLLVAQAHVEGLALVTADRTLQQYAVAVVEA